MLAANVDGKPQIAVAIDEKVLQSRNLHAGQLVKTWAKHIQGGGGGQPFFATAGGKKVGGLPAVVKEARAHIQGIIALIKKRPTVKYYRALILILLLDFIPD